MDALVRRYQAEEEQRRPPSMRLGDRAQRVFSSVQAFCEWRLGRAPFPGDGLPNRLSLSLSRSPNSWSASGRSGSRFHAGPNAAAAKAISTSSTRFCRKDFVGQPILAAAGFQPARFTCESVGCGRHRRSRQRPAVAHVNSLRPKCERMSRRMAVRTIHAASRLIGTHTSRRKTCLHGPLERLTRLLRK
jgi:hypothetical protein